MTSINFNESSVGDINDDKVALEIRNKGRGGGIKCTASVPGVLELNSEAGIVGKATGVAGIGILGESENPGGIDDGLGRGRSIGGTGVKGLTKSKFGIGILGEAQNAEGGTGVMGTTKTGKGVFGTSETDDGVRGESQAGIGVFGVTDSTLSGNLNSNVEQDIKGVGVVGIGRAKASVGLWGETSHAEGGAGVVGRSKAWLGIHGQSDTHIGVLGLGTGEGAKGVMGDTTHAKGGAGVVGKSVSIGVQGISNNFIGVKGQSETGVGVEGDVGSGIGVRGVSKSGLPGGIGIGVKGVSISGRGFGVFGEGNGLENTPEGPKGGTGVFGQSAFGVGILGDSMKGVGVKGIGKDPGATGVWGENPLGGGVGVAGISKNNIGVFGQGPIAGLFEGNVTINGTLNGHQADCAEDFDIEEAENVEPGTVMVLNKKGSLQPSWQEYDKKVAGILSGAGDCKPAIVLDRRQVLDPEDTNRKKDRLPVALMGKVYCKVDARDSSIEIGDLLTTSSSKGYAMKAEDPAKAFGAVIGKALGSIKEGLGMIPVLVTLQ